MCRAVGRTRTSGTELEVEKRREKCGEKRKVQRVELEAAEQGEDVQRRTRTSGTELEVEKRKVQREEKSTES